MSVRIHVWVCQFVHELWITTDNPPLAKSDGANGNASDTMVCAVFVDESRQVLGLKIDYNTPKMYLLDTKTALDQIIELAAEE